MDMGEMDAVVPIALLRFSVIGNYKINIGNTQQTGWSDEKVECYNIPFDILNNVPIELF